MNKKLLIFGLFVFIAGLMAMSYVSAGADIEVYANTEDFETGSIDQDQIPVTQSEDKILKDGKSISKTVKISKEVKKYSKAKKLKLTANNKKQIKKVIKKARDKGVNHFMVQCARHPYKLEPLHNSKIVKITFKTAYNKDKILGGNRKVKYYKVTVKYKPMKLVKVTKTATARITMNKDYDVKIQYTNPFNHKKTTEYGGMIYY